MVDTELGFQIGHDHSLCYVRAFRAAQEICKQRGARLTPIRELVLKTIWQSHKPVGAYDLLPTLAASGFNSAPPTIYRALDFLQEYGLVHKIATLNAYIGCPDPESQHQGSFLICRECSNAVEIETRAIERDIAQQAQKHAFIPEQQAVEVLGLCPNCHKSSD